jgi:cytochrome c biogenesis protein CcdA
MDSFWLAITSACWLGILTSISPCPLATNIAAITFIGKRVDRPRKVLLSGIMYTLGRMLAYVGLAALIVASILSVPDLAMFLQQYMNKILGPILIVAGLFLLEVFRVRLPTIGSGEKIWKRVERYGVLGAGILGLLFALSFCPVSAALFFGSLIPLAIEHESEILMPTVYGVGTALPVVIFAVLIALGTRFVGAAFKRLTAFEIWARRITGVVFIAVGVYYSVTYLLNVNIW